jgi:hypothetical protein
MDQHGLASVICASILIISTVVSQTVRLQRRGAAATEWLRRADGDGQMGIVVIASFQLSASPL